jgi:hypothetical protein
MGTLAIIHVESEEELEILLKTIVDHGGIGLCLAHKYDDYRSTISTRQYLLSKFKHARISSVNHSSLCSQYVVRFHRKQRGSTKRCPSFHRQTDQFCSASAAGASVICLSNAMTFKLHRLWSGKPWYDQYDVSVSHYMPRVLAPLLGMISDWIGCISYRVPG